MSAVALTELSQTSSIADVIAALAVPVLAVFSVAVSKPRLDGQIQSEFM